MQFCHEKSPFTPRACLDALHTSKPYTQPRPPNSLPRRLLQPSPISLSQQHPSPPLKLHQRPSRLSSNHRLPSALHWLTVSSFGPSTLYPSSRACKLADRRSWPLYYKLRHSLSKLERLE